jgi:hypothetical protein
MRRQDQQSLTPVVRISTGRFDPARIEENISAVQAPETTLRQPIGALPGLVAYCVGIDRDRSTITNTRRTPVSASARSPA